MFVLAKFQDVVKINPSLYKNDLQSSIIDLLNKKLANKVCLKYKIFFLFMYYYYTKFKLKYFER